MFGDYLILDGTSEHSAKAIYKNLDKKLLLNRTLITIGGISGTRKSETAYRLAEILINSGKQSHIISCDDYYTTPWHIRNSVRKKNLSIVGPEEIDWRRMGWTVETWENSIYAQIHIFMLSKFTTDLMQLDIDKSTLDVLIVEGLYANDLRIPSNFRVHLGDTNPESTFYFRRKRKKEDEDSAFRKKVVELECKAVAKLTEHADLIVPLKK